MWSRARFGVRDRIMARGANTVSRNLAPREAGFSDSVDLINTAHSDPAFLSPRRLSTCGGDERRHDVAEEAEFEPRAAGESFGRAGDGSAATSLTDFGDLGAIAGSRVP